MASKREIYDSNMRSFDREGQGLLQMFLGEALPGGRAAAGDESERAGEESEETEGLDFYQCPMYRPLLHVGRISGRDFSSGKIPLFVWNGLLARVTVTIDLSLSIPDI